MKAVSAAFTLIIDDNILSNRERLAESPVVSECRSKSNVHARTRESTREENELDAFSDIAEEAYTTEDFVQEVIAPRL
jgi:hypothetical protein